MVGPPISDLVFCAPSGAQQVARENDALSIIARVAGDVDEVRHRRADSRVIAAHYLIICRGQIFFGADVVIAGQRPSHYTTKVTVDDEQTRIAPAERPEHVKPLSHDVRPGASSRASRSASTRPQHNRGAL
jgi:hypothetical protein